MVPRKHKAFIAPESDITDGCARERRSADDSRLSPSLSILSLPPIPFPIWMLARWGAPRFSISFGRHSRALRCSRLRAAATATAACNLGGSRENRRVKMKRGRKWPLESGVTFLDSRARTRRTCTSANGHGARCLDENSRHRREAYPISDLSFRSLFFHFPAASSTRERIAATRRISKAARVLSRGTPTACTRKPRTVNWTSSTTNGLARILRWLFSCGSDANRVAGAIECRRGRRQWQRLYSPHCCSASFIAHERASRERASREDVSEDRKKSFIPPSSPPNSEKKKHRARGWICRVRRVKHWREFDGFDNRARGCVWINE